MVTANSDYVFKKILQATQKIKLVTIYNYPGRFNKKSQKIIKKIKLI